MLFVPSTDTTRYLSLQEYQQAEDIIEEEEVKTEGTKEKRVRFDDTHGLVSTRIFVRGEEERPSLLRRFSKATANCFRSRGLVPLCLVILGVIAFGFSQLVQSLDAKNLEAQVSPFMGNNTTLFRVMPNATNLTTTLPTA